MGVSDWIAVAALVLSVFTLGWTLYRELLGRTRFKVHVTIAHPVSDTGQFGKPVISIEFVNTGFVATSVGLPFVTRPLWRRVLLRQTTFGQIVRVDAWPHATPTNTKLEPGELGRYYLPIPNDLLSKTEFNRLGLYDTFGRKHFAPKKDIKNIRKHGQ